MRRRVTQVTKITKTVDSRLQQLEEKVQKIEDLINSLEEHLPPQTPEESAPESSTFTYTISKKT